MTAILPDSALELRSTVTLHGTLELSLHDVPVPTPSTNEVLVRVEASPINVGLGRPHPRRGHDYRDGGGHAGAPHRHSIVGSRRPGRAFGTNRQTASRGQ
jgi:hypothetical protein